jgi:hypothetical protein
MRLFVRTIGLARAAVKIGMANMAYNMNGWSARAAGRCLIRKGSDQAATTTASASKPVTCGPLPKVKVSRRRKSGPVGTA